MPEENKETPEVKPPTPPETPKVTAAPQVRQTASVFNEQAVQQKMDKIAENVNKTAGQRGKNPFIWVQRVVQPLVDRFMKGERTKELEKAILSLPDEPEHPKIQLSDTEQEAMKKQQEDQQRRQQQQTGLKFPQK